MEESGQWPASNSGKANPGAWVIHFGPEPGVLQSQLSFKLLSLMRFPVVVTLSQFPYLQLVDISSGLLEGLQKIMHPKLLAQCLAKDQV